jgi:hypothetical protein
MLNVSLSENVGFIIWSSKFFIPPPKKIIKIKKSKGINKSFYSKEGLLIVLMTG